MRDGCGYASEVTGLWGEAELGKLQKRDLRYRDSRREVAETVGDREY